MTYTEFRLGNLVMDAMTGEALQVVTIKEYDIVTKVLNRDKFPLPDGWQMTEMPLTEISLSAVGFIRVNDNGLWQYKHDDDFHLQDRIEEEDGWDFNMRSEGISIIQYMHELQNLIFAITGEELIVDLEKLKL